MKVNHVEDKKYLLGLIEALSISRNNLKRDELGYWRLVGRRGFIDTDSEYWYVRIECTSKVRWNNVKTALQNMHLWQDGCDEGSVRLGKYPDDILAQKIRKILGFTRSKRFSENEKELLKLRLNS